jgi:MiaB-like tRNA modifying enzyme
MPNIYIETYGCSNNQAESEIMAGLLKISGFEIVKNIENSDLIILNSCWVKHVTELKLLSRLKQIQDNYPDKKIIVGGCAPEIGYNKIIDTAPNASIISTNQIKKIVSVARRTLNGERVEYIGKKKEVKLSLPRIRRNPIVAIVPILSGCKGECSYCCVKNAKGELFTYPEEMILEEVKNSVKGGCKEIWITSQDNAAYDNLPELLDKITSLKGNFFVRIGMMNPDNVKPILKDLIKSYRDKKIYKFLHLPVQSGDNQLLKEMKREYSVNDFKEIVKEFRNNFNLQLWTDVIVGFPRETQEQFENTIKLLNEIKPDWTNISKYGARQYTLASQLKPLKSEIVKQRSKQASELVGRLSLEKNKQWLDWSGYVLISEKTRNGFIGRNYAYKPVLTKGRLGENLKVKITDALITCLIGKPLYAES